MLVGAGWRVVTQLSFGTALVVPGSVHPLAFVRALSPGVDHVSGYPLLVLWPLSAVTTSLAPVAVLQHLMGLATALAVYALLLRWGVWRWLAALAVLPALWEARVLASEQLVLPDTLLLLLVAAALLVLCWRAGPGPAAALAGGALLGVAAVVGPIATPLLVVAAVFALAIGTTWRNRVVGAVLVVVGFALPVVSYAAWYYAAHDVVALAQHQGDGPAASTWQLGRYVASAASSTVRQPGADLLVSYQRHAQLPDAVLVGCLVLALLGAAGLGRAHRSGMRAVCLLSALLPVALLLDPLHPYGGGFAWGGRLPGTVLLPAAGALGLTALLRGRRGVGVNRPQLDDVDRAALDGFQDRYGDAAVAPVAVVIAAYNEATGLPRVLATIPPTVCGLGTDVVVVDDGSTDGTPSAVQAVGGAYLVACGVNRGQGAAMRLGYRVARDRGARFIITTDADAQYDTADFPTVLGPLIDGSADFVSGSRLLGRQHTNDRVRRVGVHVFAWIASALTGRRLTDTSFGLRAMRAELTAAVTLNQPQYQSSELLLGVHSHGYRIVEVPGTMHVRAAGTTKKGRNLVYGSRYARVVFGTWWREGCPAPVTECAPALAGRRDVAQTRPVLGE